VCVDSVEFPAREVLSLLLRMRFPATPDSTFAYLTSAAIPDQKGAAQAELHEGVFTTSWKRDCFFDEFNENLDHVMLGGFTESKISTNWRVCTANDKYALCPSYPRRLIIPESFSDEEINELAKFHKKKRFPVVSWRSPMNKCVILRAALTKYPRFGPPLVFHISCSWQFSNSILPFLVGSLCIAEETRTRDVSSTNTSATSWQSHRRTRGW